MHERERDPRPDGKPPAVSRQVTGLVIRPVCRSCPPLQKYIFRYERIDSLSSPQTVWQEEKKLWDEACDGDDLVSQFKLSIFCATDLNACAIYRAIVFIKGMHFTVWALVEGLCIYEHQQWKHSTHSCALQCCTEWFLRRVNYAEKCPFSAFINSEVLRTFKSLILV